MISTKQKGGKDQRRNPSEAPFHPVINKSPEDCLLRNRRDHAVKDKPDQKFHAILGFMNSFIGPRSSRKPCLIKKDIDADGNLVLKDQRYQGGEEEEE